MCDPRLLARRWVLATMVVSAFIALPSHGQSVDRTRARLLAATRLSRTLEDSAKLLHELRTRELPPDSIVAGDLRFRFVKPNLDADMQAKLQAAGTRVLLRADSTLGDALPGIASSVPILVFRAEVHNGNLPTVDRVTLEIADGGGRSTSVRAPVTQWKLEEAISDLLGTMATAHAPTGTIRWSGEWVPSQPLRRDAWEEAAVNLASSTAAIARTCYSGSESACESALGLTEVHDPLTEWYTPEGMRILVSNWSPPKDAYTANADRAECVDKKVMATCERIARGKPTPIPLTFGTRQTLFALALADGGRAGYARMLGATGTPLQVLSIAAGVSADSLIHQWHSRVVAATPMSASPSPLEASVFVAWALLFGLAAGRRRP